MNPQPQAPKAVRHKCAACYKQYKKKEHLIEHMRVSYHSVHQPQCGACKKHCKSLESVREHLKGPLPKGNCAKIFAARGCDLCLNLFDSPDALSVHQSSCRMAPASFPNFQSIPPVENLSHSGVGTSCSTRADDDIQGVEFVAMDCEMVGGGSDGSLDLCARVCLVGQDENVIFHTYVKPLIPVSNYRYELTSITEEHLVDAMPLLQAKEKVEEILYNGESVCKARLEGGKARILVGHDLDHDLDCLKINYPGHLIRDTAKYPSLMRTNLVSHSLKYLTQTYLGYEIQSGVHDPFEDCVAALRLYKRMQSQLHQTESLSMSDASNNVHDAERLNNFYSYKLKDLEKMSPGALLEMSVSNFRCWCLDRYK